MTAQLEPLRIRAFRRLAFSYAVNGLGDWVGEIALSILVYRATGSVLAVAALWILQRFLPALLTPVFVTRLEAIRSDRLLPVLYVTEAVAFCALAGLADGLVLWLALPLVLIDGAVAPVARALTRTTVVAVTRPAGLHREGNSLLNLVLTAQCAAGPALGGLIVLGVGVETALMANAGSFLLVALALGVRSQLPRVCPEPEPLLPRLRSGLSFVRNHSLLRTLLGAEAISGIFFAMILPVEIVFVTSTLGSNEAGYGAVLTAWGVGMVLGGVAAARLARASLPILLGGSSLAMVAAYLGMGTAGGLEAVVLWSAVGGIGNGLYGMAFLTTVQERTPDDFQARVSGLYEALQTAMPGLGYLAGGLVAAALSPRAVYLVAGCGALAILGWAMSVLWRAEWGIDDASLRSELTPVATRPPVAAAA